MSKSRFLECKHCHNLVGLIRDSGVEIICCGEPMTELVPRTEDTGHEKHLPQVSTSGNEVSVNVGSIEHPMGEDHLIEWVYLETERGGMRKAFKSTDKPIATFCVTDDKAVAAWAYCNLHGLWKKEIK